MLLKKKKLYVIFMHREDFLTLASSKKRAASSKERAAYSLKLYHLLQKIKIYKHDTEGIHVTYNLLCHHSISVLLYTKHTHMHIYLSIALAGLESRGTRIFLVISVLMIKITQEHYEDCPFAPRCFSLCMRPEATSV